MAFTSKKQATNKYTTNSKANSKMIKDLFFCTIVMVITVLMCFLTRVNNASAAAAELDSNALLEMAKENGGVVLMTGETEISRDVSVAELVRQYQSYRESLLSTSVSMYARNNSEMKPTDQNIMELKNQFAYSGKQKITVRTDVISGETKVLLERTEQTGRTNYSMYSFDCMTYQQDVYSVDTVVEFNYNGFRYVIYVDHDKFQICSVWDPIAGTKVFDVNDINNNADQNEMYALRRDFAEIFSGKYDVTELTFTEEQGFYVKIHMFVEIEGCKREYVFYTYNAKPIDEASEIIALIRFNDDDYAIYESNGWICLDSARRAGYMDNPYGTRVY